MGKAMNFAWGRHKHVKTPEHAQGVLVAVPVADGLCWATTRRPNGAVFGCRARAQVGRRCCVKHGAREAEAQAL